jgi:hypothetical protein
VLIVLALLAAVTAVAWPAMNNLFAAHRLRTAADTVRTRWCLTRVEAMRSGRTYSFRYTVDGGRFRTEHCADLDDWLPADTAQEPAAAEQEDPCAATGDIAEQSVEQNLPEGVVFLCRDSTADTPAGTAETELPATAGEDWSGPILFHPDGTTSDAHVALKNERGRTMGLTLRGVTGTVTVDEALVEEQLREESK